MTKISCEGWKPICINKDDVLTNKTADQILYHDKFGAKQCGWKSTSCTKLNGT